MVRDLELSKLLVCLLRSLRQETDLRLVCVPSHVSNISHFDPEVGDRAITRNSAAVRLLHEESQFKIDGPKMEHIYERKVAKSYPVSQILTLNARPFQRRTRDEASAFGHAKKMVDSMGLEPTAMGLMDVELYNIWMIW